MPVPRQTPGTSRQDYSTPVNFLEAAKRRLGITRFDFDFAADHINAKAGRFFNQAANALDPKWDWGSKIATGQWGWLNPPFKEIGPWARRCAETQAPIAFLVPASVGANWFRDYVDGQARVLFLNGRLAFMPDKPHWLYPKDCILCLYGPTVETGYEVWTWTRGGS